MPEGKVDNKEKIGKERLPNGAGIEVEEGGDVLLALKSEIASYVDEVTNAGDLLGKVEKDLAAKIIELKEKEAELQELMKKKEEIEGGYEEFLTKTISEYISLQLREEALKEGIAKKEDVVRRKLIDLRNREEKIKEVEALLAQERAKLSDITKGGGGNVPKAMEKLQDLLDEKDKDILDLKEKLRMLELKYRETEDKLKAAEVLSSSKTSTEREVQLIDTLHKREVELKKLRREWEKKEKELEEMKDKLNQLENLLLEKEKSLDEREKELMKREEEMMAKGGAASEIDDKLKLEYALKKKEMELKRKYEIELKKRTEDLIRKIERLERRNEDLESAAELLEEKELHIKALEKTLSEREEELSYLEEKVRRKEERLIEMQRRLEAEKKKIKEKVTGGAILLEQKSKELEELEKKLRDREEVLRRKEKEFLVRMRGVMDEEIKHEMAMTATEVGNNVTTGIIKLDELFGGGFPLNTSILFSGDKYTGVEMFLKVYLADGLRRRIPCIYVTTDDDVASVRDKMRLIIPNIREFETEGMLRYIDAFSIKSGLPAEDEAAYYIKDKNDLNEIIEVITKAIDDMKERFGDPPTIKLTFFSLTSVVMGKEVSEIYEFVQTLNIRLHKLHNNKVTATFAIQAGPLKDDVVETIKSLMSATVVLRKDPDAYRFQVETDLPIKSRDSITYEFDRKNVKVTGALKTHKIR